MVQMQTYLNVADNSGAKRVQCIKVLGGSHRYVAGVGDIIVVAVKDALPNGAIKKGDVLKAGRALLVAEGHMVEDYASILDNLLSIFVFIHGWREGKNLRYSFHAGLGHGVHDDNHSCHHQG